MNVPKFVQNTTLLIVVAMTLAAPLAFQNCGRASLGNLSSVAANNSAETNGTPTAVGTLACPAGQAPIGINSDRSVICAPYGGGTNLMCPSGSSVYQVNGTAISCVVNTSWDQPGAMCPVGSYLSSISSSGAITCVQPTLIVSTRPLNASCPAGQYLNGVQNDVAVCLPLPTSVPTAFVCPTGQYLNDLNGAAMDCKPRPWANAVSSSACPASMQAVGYAADGTLVCKQNNFISAGAAANVSCPSGQILTGYANNTAVCRAVPVADVSHACRIGYAPTGTSGGLLLCDNAQATDRNPCGDGQFVVGLSAGQPVCARVSANHLPASCAAGSYPVGVSNGAIVCVAFENTRYPSSALACFPGETSICAVDGGIGSQTCSLTGDAQSTCVATSCVSGRELSNGVCRVLACQPGVSQSCPVVNGNGLQYCDSRGQYGSCQVQACNNGYVSQNGKCEAVTCTPGNTVSCSVAASGTSGGAFGFQTCNSNGVGYGKCYVTSCQNGFTLRDQTCIDSTAPRVTFITVPMNPTVGSSATLAFSASDPETGLRSTQCQLDGAVYPACTSPVMLTNLATGAHSFSVTAIDNSGNETKQTATWRTDACSAGQTQSCNVPNGTGRAMCQADGAYGVCVADQCASGYEVKNGMCQALMCPVGYSVSGNKCVDNTAPVLTIGSGPQDPTIGSSATFQFAASDTGSGVSAITCALDAQAAVACASPLTVTNLAYGPHTMTIKAIDKDGNVATKVLAWRTYVCAPNAQQACGIANGAGAQSCMADGSGFSSCQVVSCNNGYTQNMNQCTYVPKTCTTPSGATIASGMSTVAFESASVPYRSSCKAETRVCADGVLSGSYSNKSCAVEPAPAITPVNRFYDPRLGEHFYTTATYEWTMGNRFVGEGIGFYVLQQPAADRQMLYRCTWYVGAYIMHFISKDAMCEGRMTEGPYGYVYTKQVAGSSPLLRYFNIYNGDHLTTLDPNELARGGNTARYVSEGNLGYAPLP